MLDQDIVKENLSWIALQFLSHCQKHLNRLLVGFYILESAWGEIDESICK